MRASWPLIVGSVFTALVLSILPLSEALAVARPAFVAAIVCYWILRAPARFGIFAAGLCGLFQDVLTASLLGQHALAMGLVAYLAFKLRDTLLMFPGWQQAVVLLPVWGAYELCLHLIDQWTGHVIAPVWRWAPVLSTAVLWPLTDRRAVKTLPRMQTLLWSCVDSVHRSLPDV